MDKSYAIDVSALPSVKSTKHYANTAYLDGLRGIAVLLMFNANYIDLTFRSKYPEVLKVGSATALLRHPIALSLFFQISGYLCAWNYFAYNGVQRNSGIQFPIIATKLLYKVLQILLIVSLASIVQSLECLTPFFDRTTEAAQLLDSKTLLRPTWCININVKDVLINTLQLFSSQDYEALFMQSGTLWTTYIWLWGTVVTTIITSIALQMRGPFARFPFYFLLAICAIFTHHYTLPFLIGIALADVKGSGYLKRFQEWSRVCYIGVEIVAVGFSLVMLCDQAVADRIQGWISPFQIRNGDHGWKGVNQSTILNLQAFLVFLWVEMSPITQWIVANVFFKALGRVALGIWLTQYTILFSLTPTIISYFLRKNENEYWTSIAWTWFFTLIVNYVIGWLVVRLIASPIRTFSAWLVDRLYTHGIVDLIRESFANCTFYALHSAPRKVRNLPLSFSSMCQSARQRCHTLWHWRDPQEEAPIIMPFEHYGFTIDDMSSSYFDPDCYRDDERAMRTYRLLRLWNYAAPFNFCMLVGLIALWYFCNPWRHQVGETLAVFSVLWKILWILALPYCIICFIGYCVPDITLDRKGQQKRKVCRPMVHRLFILSVTRGSNEEATRRSHYKLKELEKYHPAVRAVVLTDEPYAYPDLNNVVTPKDYTTETGKGKHKAKALDYFRRTMNLTPYDYVLHMDEESTMDAETLRGCFDFIRYSNHQIGQGPIVYNSNGYFEGWKGYLFTVGDLMRVGDDLSRFSLQANWIQRPAFGIHGSFLLLCGQLETTVGWDFGTLAEDYELSQAAWKKGFTVGRIHGIVREQSPQNFIDFMKQRRRWYIGIRKVHGLYSLSAFTIKLWTSGIFCLVATIINILFSLLIKEAGYTPFWLYVLTSFSFGTFIWLYAGGLLFSELDHGYTWKTMYKVPLHFLAMVFLTPVMAVMESAAVCWAMSTEDDDHGFHVIKK